MLTKGSGYCRDCACKVPGCAQPRHKSWLRYRHQQCFDASPQALQYALASAPMASLSVPADVVDVLHRWGCAQKNFALGLVVALMKDQTAAGHGRGVEAPSHGL